MPEHGIEGLAAARLWAATRFPYLATGVFGAQVIADPGSGTVSVDESWRMHADPELTAGWTPAQLGSVLIHHVCHLLRTHGERAQGTGVRPDEAADWIRAADAEINDDLVPAGLELPGRPVLPRDLRAEDGLLAEQYFAGIRRQAARAAESQARSGPWLDCGSGADGIPRPGQGQGPRAACPAGRPTCYGGRSRRRSSRTASRPGPCRPGCCAGPRRSSPRRSTGARCSPPSCAGPSPRSPGRSTTPTGGRRAGPPWPGRSCCRRLRRPVPEVAVVCDTSGSMTEDLLAMVLAEVEGLLRALGLARQVRVLACDTAVAPAQRVSSARQVELIGGGGTDMGAGIGAAAALRPRPAVTVVLTDGYTPWPAAAPKGMRVVVGLLGEGAPDAPPWTRSVRVEP